MEVRRRQPTSSGRGGGNRPLLTVMLEVTTTSGGAARALVRIGEPAVAPPSGDACREDRLPALRHSCPCGSGRRQSAAIAVIEGDPDLQPFAPWRSARSGTAIDPITG